MRPGLFGGLVACGAAALVAAFSPADSGASVQAQDAQVWEYAYLVEVDRIDIHEGSVEAWSASRTDKDYFRAHVFAYQKGFAPNDRTLNRLRRINSLAEEGWALFDGDSGLLVRRRPG